MEQIELINKLKAVEKTESVFSQVMHAKTVKELLEIEAEPEELLSFVEAAEEMAVLEEDAFLFGEILYQRLKRACPVKSRKHALFM